MNDNREIIDFLYGDYYLADNKLYSVQNDYTITETSDRPTKKQLQEKLATFKKMNYYVSNEGKILPDSIVNASLGATPVALAPIAQPITFESEYQNLIVDLLTHGKEIILDIAIQHNMLPNNDCLLVCTTKSENGGLLVWKSEKIKANTTFSQLHFKMPTLPGKESKSLCLYFWNGQKQKVMVKAVEVKAFERGMMIEGENKRERK
jgi:hypothetical protein